MALLALPEETRAIIYGFLTVESAASLWVTCTGAVTRGWSVCKVDSRLHSWEAGLHCQCDATYSQYSYTTTANPIVPEGKSAEAYLQLETICSGAYAYTRVQVKAVAEYRFTAGFAFDSYNIRLLLPGDFKCTPNGISQRSKILGGSMVDRLLGEESIITARKGKIKLTMPSRPWLCVWISRDNLIACAGDKLYSTTLRALQSLSGLLYTGLTRAGKLGAEAVGSGDEAPLCKPPKLSPALAEPTPLVEPPYTIKIHWQRKPPGEKSRVTLSVLTVHSEVYTVLHAAKIGKATFMAGIRGDKHLAVLDKETDIGRRADIYSAYDISGRTPRILRMVKAHYSLTALIDAEAQRPSIIAATLCRDEETTATLCKNKLSKHRGGQGDGSVSRVYINTREEYANLREATRIINSALPEFSLQGLSQALGQWEPAYKI